MKVKEPKSLNLNSFQISISEGQKVFMFLMPESEAAKCKLEQEFDIIDFIPEGIPKRAVDNLLGKTSLTRPQLSNILHISSRQLNRYSEGDRLSSEQSNFLYELGRLYVRATDIFGDVATANSWSTAIFLRVPLLRPSLAAPLQSPFP